MHRPILQVKNMQRDIKNAFDQWPLKLDAQYAFTGTLMQARLFNGAYRTYDRITLERTKNNIDQFIERLSRSILGRKNVRLGKKLEYVGSIEGSLPNQKNKLKRLHVHLSISGIPELYDPVDFEYFAIKRWEQSQWGYREAFVSELKNDADKYSWNSYSLKELQKNGSDYFITNLPYTT